MCGIIGGWCAEEVNDEALEAALVSMAHRGPDDSGVFRSGRVFLGVRRLAIIDLEGGRQPFATREDATVAVLNGEIYNYVELADGLRRAGHRFRTESDTEVLVHVYEDRGPQMCQPLRGMYAFALWDAGARRLTLARDRFGKKPLYYARTPSGGLIFASELKALRPLASATGTELRLREQALYDYLSLGMIPQPETVFEGAFALPPGSLATFDGRTLRTEPYWNLDYSVKRELPYADALERVRELVSEAVRLRLRSDVPLGVFLSGGIDSSAITYEAVRHAGCGLRTFTVALPHSALDESHVAARTAHALDVQNTVLPLRVTPLDELRRLVGQYDQPYADSSAIPSLAVARLARQHVTVVLNGDGGDELFAGYRRYVAARLAGLFARVPPFCTKVAAGALSRVANGRRTALGFAQRFCRGVGLPAGARYVAWTSDMLLESDKQQIWKGSRMRPTEEWIESILPQGLSGLDTQTAGDLRVILLSDLLVKMDIATMAASVEGRSPMMDHRLAEFTAGLPDSHRLRRFQPKRLLRDAYRGRLPDEVLGGRKRGFEVPLKEWLEGDLREILGDTLGSSSARVRDLVADSFVDGLLDRTVLRDRNWAYLVYALLVLEIWLREFG
jgi:asparagine synthase (glutamine-hydrolysing)